jgi:3-oxoacyl-[acyl-carrier protein] reductase
MKRRVLVTGSSRGIGRAIALRLAKEGFGVTLHYHKNQERVLETAALMDGTPEILHFDVSQRDETVSALQSSVTEHGAFYGVVLNAGITHDAPFPGLEAEGWDGVLRTNLDGFYNVLSPLVMPMIQQRCGGRIVCLSSIAGIVGNRGQVNYSAAKAGIIGATKALAKELAKRRITVNCVAPGFIETDMTRDLPQEEIKRAIPMQRAGRPEEVASPVAFLFQDDAEYITGQVLAVSGGLV